MTTLHGWGTFMLTQQQESILSLPGNSPLQTSKLSLSMIGFSFQYGKDFNYLIMCQVHISLDPIELSISIAFLERSYTLHTPIDHFCFRSPLWFMYACILSHVPLFVTSRSLPGSSVRSIFQANILEWSAISFSRGSFQPRDWTHVSYVSCIGRRILYHCTTWEGSPCIICMYL